MTRWLAPLLLFLSTGFAWGQTVPVRSGEHGEFTRLVLDVPDGTTWALEPTLGGERITLRLSGGPYLFETTSVYSRIGTERVAALTSSQDGRGLGIDLGCQCAAQAFVHSGTMLVVDIAPSVVPMTAAKGDLALLVSRDAMALDSPFQREFSQIQFDGAPRIGPQSVDISLLTFLEDNVAVGMDPLSVDPSSSDATVTRDLGDQLAADLAVAATQGLLDPSFTSQITPTSAAKPKSEPEIPTDLAIDPGALARRLAAGISGLDHQTLQDGHISVGGENCIPDSKLMIAAWSEPKDDPNLVLAKRRGKVFGEFDRIAPDLLREYAEALLYYGFGAETRSVLALSPEDQDPILKSLSHIIDGQHDPDRLFDRLSNCVGAAALWSVLSEAPSPNDPEIAGTAILRSFESLPRHLRSHLGPRLAAHLSEAGYAETARDVLRRLQRMEGRETDSIALGTAQLDLKDGLHADVGKRLHDLSIAGGPEAARAVAAAVDLAEATDTLVPARIVELSEAFASELRNNPDGEDLWKAHVRSLLINGMFDAAFTEFEEHHGMPDSVVGFMQQVALKALVERAGDVTFLKIATRSQADDLVPDQSAVTLAFSERFLALGLAEAALAQLDAIPAAKRTSDEKIMRAEALIALGRPEQAEIILIGQRGERVVRLRAEARRQMGDHVFAKSIFADIGEEPAALNAAWLSGDWKDVAESNSALAPAADLMQSPPLLVDETAVTLAAGDALSDASAQSLETLRALLAATALSADD